MKKYKNKSVNVRKQLKIKLNTLLRYIRSVKARHKKTLQGKVKDTKDSNLFDFN